MEFGIFFCLKLSALSVFARNEAISRSNSTKVCTEFVLPILSSRGTRDLGNKLYTVTLQSLSSYLRRSLVPRDDKIEVKLCKYANCDCFVPRKDCSLRIKKPLSKFKTLTKVYAYNWNLEF